MFRNYPSRHSSPNPTIVEAALTSWATPGLFSPVHIGSQLHREELVSAVYGFNNPTLEAVQELREIFGMDKAMSSFLSLGSGRRPPVSSNSSGLLQSKALDTDVIEQKCERDLKPSGIYHRFSPEHTIQSESPVIENKQLNSITSYTDVYLELVQTNRDLEIYLESSVYKSDSDLDFRAQGEILALSPSRSKCSPIDWVIAQ